MTLNVKKLSICSLISCFIVSAIVCCCLTDFVQAKEQTPSCHQSTQEDAPSQSADECGCDQYMNTVKESAFLLDQTAQFDTIIAYEQSIGHNNMINKIVAFHAPPNVYDTLPLYIKHSILRL